MMPRDNEETENDDALHQVITALRQMPRPAPPESLRRRVMAQVWSEGETPARHIDVLITRTEEIRGQEHVFWERRDVQEHSPPAARTAAEHRWTPVPRDAFHATQID